MAEAEQDFSSLPLADRFAHKVRFGPYVFRETMGGDDEGQR
jgi:hypothetical protein